MLGEGIAGLGILASFGGLLTFFIGMSLAPSDWALEREKLITTVVTGGGISVFVGIFLVFIGFSLSRAI